MCSKIARSVELLLVGALAMTMVARQAQAELEFGMPTPMPEPFNVGGIYGYPWLSEDGLDIYFASDRSAPFAADPSDPDSVGTPGSVDIWTAHRDSLTDDWKDFVDLGAPVNTPGYAEFGQSLTADGQEMYFVRALSPFGIPEGDLFVSKRQPDNSWGEPQPLAELNTAEREHYPSISADGKTLYFTSFGNPNYPSPNGLVPSTWVATRSSRSEPFANPEFFFDGFGIVTSDGLTHLFAGDQAFADFYDVPNAGGDPGLDYDLYVRTRDSIREDFGPVQHLPPPVAGGSLECCGWYSSADSTLYFSSIRPGTDITGDIGFVDLWQAPLVPEPSSLWMLVAGLSVWALRSRT